MTQRLIKAVLARSPMPYSGSEMVAVAARCTQQEDNANKVERAVRKSAAAILLEHRIGAKFDSVVTGASPKGTWVRIWRPSVEGKLDVGEERYQVGDHVRVRLVHTDVEARIHRLQAAVRISTSPQDTRHEPCFENKNSVSALGQQDYRGRSLSLAASALSMQPRARRWAFLVRTRERKIRGAVASESCPGAPARLRIPPPLAHTA